MSVRIVSYEAAVKVAIQAQLAGNLEDAAAYYEDRVKAKIGVQGPPRSTPGSPPHRDTSDLYNSIDHQTDAASLTARIGSDMPYAGVLEIGGGHVAERPYFVPTLIEESDEIGRRVCKP